MARNDPFLQGSVRLRHLAESPTSVKKVWDKKQRHGSWVRQIYIEFVCFACTLSHARINCSHKIPKEPRHLPQTCVSNNGGGLRTAKRCETLHNFDNSVSFLPFFEQKLFYFIRNMPLRGVFMSSLFGR